MLYIGRYMERPNAMLSPERPCAHVAPDIAGSAGLTPPSSAAAARTAAQSRLRPPPPWQNGKTKHPNLFLQDQCCAHRYGGRPLESLRWFAACSAGGVSFACGRGQFFKSPDKKCACPTGRDFCPVARAADNSLFGNSDSLFREVQGIGRKPFGSRRDPAPRPAKLIAKVAKSEKLPVNFPVGREFADPGGTRAVSVDCPRQASMQ
jgi:hypothetical protein